MAKRTNKPPAAEPDEVGESLIELAEILLVEHFFDPNNESLYKVKLAGIRRSGEASTVLDRQAIELPSGTCDLQIEGLRTWNQIRVALSHPAFAATIDGTWSFETETLARTKVTRSGDDGALEAAVDAMIDGIDGSGLDDEEFADFIAELEAEDGETAPLIGDDPQEPPEATALDRSRIKAIAKRVARHADREVTIEDRAWLERTPQTLPVITESLIALASAAERDEPLILAHQMLLALQLEFVRYRQDRGWEWADAMLEAFGQRLITLGNEGTVPRDDWFTMCSALTQARVPISDSLQMALADAGFEPDDDPGPPEQMMAKLRGFMDELAKVVSSPFEVMQGLQNAGAMLPPMLRQFMALELALSPHPVLRGSVPIMLLDEDAAVRKGAAAALEQTARPATLAPDALRRSIAVRNWIPLADRAPLDAAIRKARLAGVEIGAWPAPVRELEYHASAIDGSGAQSVLIASRLGRKGFFGGLLLRHGTGVVDSWADPDLARGKINKLLREARMSAPHMRVDQTYIDLLVQHGIGTATMRGEVPPTGLLEMAELIGGAEWKDRSLNIEGEALKLFGELDPEDRTPGGIEAGLARGLDWMTDDEVFATWFEDGPQVQQVLAPLPRTDQARMTAVVMTEILPNKRPEWTERFLMMALWSKAAADVRQQAKAADLVLVAHALAGDVPMERIPVMGMIAQQTVRATLLGAW